MSKKEPSRPREIYKREEKKEVRKEFDPLEYGGYSN